MYYRSLIVSLLLSISVTPAIRAQTSEEKIKAIRQRFQEISQEKGFTKVRLESDEAMEAAPDNGVELTGWFKGDSLVKMHFSVGQSFGLEDFEYYYDHGQPVFIYETQRCFHMDSTGIDQTRIALNFEGRYYLDKGAVIEMKLKGQKQLSDEVNEAYIQKLIAEADDYAERLNKRLKK